MLSFILGLSSPPLGPHNNNLNREDVNCIEEADESSAMPIFIFMVAQVRHEFDTHNNVFIK